METHKEDPALLPRLSSRADYFDYLDGYTVKTAEELHERRLTGGLVKTYMLETLGDVGPRPDVMSIFQEAGVQVHPVGDDGLFRVHDPGLEGDVALLEVLDDRHPVLYTVLRARRSDRWVHHLVRSSPWLDRLWLSARLFRELWRYVQRMTPSYRYTRMAFEYEGFFEPPEAYEQESERDEVSRERGDPEQPDEEGDELEDVDDEDAPRMERRSSRSTIVERIDTVQTVLPQLQAAYQPLASIVQLRVPAPGRGGHDFYFDGKVTNRGEAFADHRETVKFVLGTYRRVTEAAEDRLWLETTDVAPEGTGFSLTGSPVLLEFSRPLEQATFDRFIESTFMRKNRLRLGGRPFRMGPRKVHVYGVDRHLWRPVMLEVTHRYILGMLPHGTCGNTVHRLVTNVQHYLDPGVQAWIADEPFEGLVDSALLSA